MPSPNTQPLRAALSAERRRRGWTQANLGQRLGRDTYSIVSGWERGVREPTLTNFLQWAHTLGFRVELVPNRRGNA